MRRTLPKALLGWLPMIALVIALVMGLTLPLAAAARAEAPPSGARLFAQHCAGCHVNGGNIIRRNKTLKLAALQRNGITTEAAIAVIAAQGIGQMGGYRDKLGAGGPEAVASWVWQQAQAGWPKP